MPLENKPRITEKLASYTTYGGFGSIGAFILDSADLMQAISIWLMVIGLIARLVYDTVRFIDGRKK